MGNVMPKAPPREKMGDGGYGNGKRGAAGATRGAQRRKANQFSDFTHKPPPQARAGSAPPQPRDVGYASLLTIGSRPHPEPLAMPVESQSVRNHTPLEVLMIWQRNVNGMASAQCQRLRVPLLFLSRGACGAALSSIFLNCPLAAPSAPHIPTGFFLFPLFCAWGGACGAALSPNSRKYLVLVPAAGHQPEMPFWQLISEVCAHFFEFYRSPRVRSASAAVSPWPWNSTVSGHGAGVARAIGHLLAWVARARRGHGACMSCSPRDIAPCCWSWSLGGAAGPRRILQQARKCGSAGLLGVQREKKYSFQTFKHI
eukprot:gene15001-biopygen6636